MDSRTHLEYALFQLTPTRTRCDLVIFAGGKSEKLASGLLEPFLTHLKCAKDQISKGGYSITLRPDSRSAAWFTKATLERFVRFVSTPEILERFVTIEKEIAHLEDSIHSNEQSNGVTDTEGNSKANGAQAKADSNGSANDTPQQNSKVHLLRALESRKAVLRKEQAMAYARALVAGFEEDDIDGLISFSDAFGAKRLRDACNDFMELCNKKSNDNMWMDEVARMQAISPEFSFSGTSGIIIASEANGAQQVDASVVSDTTTNADNGLTKAQSSQVPPPWAQFMQNFQGPPQYPPYQGYYYPGMHPQPYYPGNVSGAGHHPPDDHHHRRSKSSKNKKKTSNGSDELSHSSSGSNSDDLEDNGRRHSMDSAPKKKSSRKVVIRNINYITSKRNGERGSNSSDDSSDEDDEVIDADSLKQQVDEALGSFDKRHKSTSGKKSRKRDGIRKSKSKMENVSDHDLDEEMPSEGEKKGQNWDAFQNLLMKDAEEQATDMGRSNGDFNDFISNGYSGKGNISSFIVEAESTPKTRGIASDAFLLDRASVTGESEARVDNFEAGESVRGIIKRGNGDEELILSSRVTGSEMYSNDPLSHSGTEPSIMKSQREEDWFAANRPDISRQENRISMLADDPLAFGVGSAQQNKESNRDVLADDSFMIQSAPSSVAEQKTDIFLEADIIGSNHNEDDQEDGVRADAFHEPDDLYMVLGRDSAASEQFAASWNPEMDYNDGSEAVKKAAESSDRADAKKLPNGKPGKATPNGKAPNRPGMPRTTPGLLGRSKSEIPSRTRTMTTKVKSDQEEEKRKKIEEVRLERQRRIAERSAAAASRMKKSPVSAAPTQEMKKPQKTVFRNSTIDRLSAARTTADARSSAESKSLGQNKKAVSREKVKPSDKKARIKNSTVSASVPDAENIQNVLPEPALTEEQNSSKDRGQAMETIEFQAQTESITVPRTEAPEPRISTPVEDIEMSMSPENHTRKKWNDGETSPMISKGFRKLLLFGRKN